MKFFCGIYGIVGLCCEEELLVDSLIDSMIDCVCISGNFLIESD